MEVPFGEAVTRVSAGRPGDHDCAGLELWRRHHERLSASESTALPSLFQQLVIDTSRPFPGAHSVPSRRLWRPREARGRERVPVLTEVARPPPAGVTAALGRALELSEGGGYRALVRVRSGATGEQRRGHRHCLVSPWVQEAGFSGQVVLKAAAPASARVKLLPVRGEVAMVTGACSLPRLLHPKFAPAPSPSVCPAGAPHSPRDPSLVLPRGWLSGEPGSCPRRRS